MAEVEGPNAALKEPTPTDATEWANLDHPCLGVNRILDPEAGTVELLMPDGKTPRRKFAIMGFAGSTRDMAPLNDPETAIVGLNQLSRLMRHPVLDADGQPVVDESGAPVTELRHGDLWFEIHREWNTALTPNSDHEGWLRDFGQPVFMHDTVPGFDTSLRFPVERLIEKFDIDYFTSTIAYMFAWCIDHIDRLVAERLANFERNGAGVVDAVKLAQSVYNEYTMGVYGIDLIAGSEYEDQRPCAEFWLGQAMARNIDLVIPRQSALLKQHYRYGYDIESPGHIRKSDIEARMQWARQHQAQHHELCCEIYGRLEELKNPPASDEARAERIEALTAKHQEQSQEALQFGTAIKESQYWQQVFTLRERGGEL